MSKLSRPAALAALVLVLVGCSSSGVSSVPPASAGTSIRPSVLHATASPSLSDVLEHSTGPRDVILRYDEGGGMMMPSYTAANAPAFTLYGDGTLIFRDTLADPPPAIGSVIPLHPFRTAKMNEDQIQALLGFALGEGGLGAARAEYMDMLISDAATSKFTVNAGGVSKTVSVYALGYEQDGMADLLARKTLAKLRDHLLDIDQGGTVQTDVYAPDRYRGYLFEGQPGVPDTKAWPWSAVKTAEFVAAGDVNAFPMPARVMTAGEIETLAIEPYQGGFIGLPLAGPGDGKAYTLTVRPLLPDDAP
jgi:hypothetical protein